MKKTLLAILAGVFALGLVACEQRVEEKTTPDGTTVTTPATETKPVEPVTPVEPAKPAEKPAETKPAQ